MYNRGMTKRATKTETKTKAKRVRRDPAYERDVRIQDAVYMGLKSKDVIQYVERKPKR